MRAPVTVVAVALAVAGCGGPRRPAPVELTRATTFSESGDRAVSGLLQTLWSPDGHWSVWDGDSNSGNQDWGDDALTFTLAMRWADTQDPALVPIFAELTETATDYGSNSCNGVWCFDWSDMPEWDAVADLREYEATLDEKALRKASAAYRHVRDFSDYRGGACPELHFQRAGGGGGRLKTLETDSNAIKAALLLWRHTGEQSYLDDAISLYAAVRLHFLDPHVALYTAYLFDDGHECRQLPQRFFASVNGNMIWNGLALADATGDQQFLRDALDVASAVDTNLSDGRGIFANLMAENDVAEPLVEAFNELAKRQVEFARAWITRNADAAVRNTSGADGLLGRFFDGPRQDAPVTAWQTNGGLALSVAAATLEPDHRVERGSDWDAATTVPVEIREFPASLQFEGSGVALIGTLGEHCCEGGHAQLNIDGVPTSDLTGIWQNKSSANRAFENTVLFAWQWPSSGLHTIDFVAPAHNEKEGGPFIHIQSYRLLRSP